MQRKATKEMGKANFKNTEQAYSDSSPPIVSMETEAQMSHYAGRGTTG